MTGTNLPYHCTSVNFKIRAGKKRQESKDDNKHVEHEVGAETDQMDSRKERLVSL